MMERKSYLCLATAGLQLTSDALGLQVILGAG